MGRFSLWAVRLLTVAAAVELAVALLIVLTGGFEWRGVVSITATDPTRPAIVACLLLALRLMVRPPRLMGPLLVVLLLPLVALLLAQSNMRRVGDGAEYVAMAMNFAHGQPPSLTPAEITRASAVFVGDDGFDLVMPAFRGADGRQDFPHFWLYSLLAAPFVRVALAMGVHPVAGFTALNLLLLSCALFAIMWRYGAMPALLLVAGPILWWVDKAHTEAFTFALLTAAIVLLPSTPWWSLVLIGLGAAQNPPLLLAWGVVVLAAFVARGLRDRRVWAGAFAGAALAAMHPLYYWLRLGRWSGLIEGVDRHVPSLRELLTVAIDPNVGIFVLDPFLTVALLVALALVLARAPRRLRSVDHLAALGMAVALLVAFAQTTNFNSGGTPGPSRYGLWLLPLTLPLLGDVPDGAGWARGLVAASMIWCVVFFAPRAPDHYLEPTPIALRLWTTWPGLDNPIAEVFAERLTGKDPSPPPPIATAGCEKVLLFGPGGPPAWPASCQAVPAPDFCQRQGALCYANRDGSGYDFTEAPSGPAWWRGHGGE